MSVDDFIPLYDRKYGICQVCHTARGNRSPRMHALRVHRDLFAARKIVIARRAFVHKSEVKESTHVPV
jgi:hypothetical protein